MALPASIEPFLDPEVLRGEIRTPESADGMRTVAMIAAGIVGLLLWDDLARHAPWTGVPAPLALLGVPAALNLPWLVAGLTMIGFAGNVAQQARRGHQTATSAVTLPRLPVFLRFDGRPVVVVGGGSMAVQKIPALLDAGARVTVIAPHVDAGVDRSRVTVRERAFQPSDLDGAWFVTAAATPDVNRDVRAAADARAVFVNAVDDPANATAYLGGTIARGGVTVAFSTAGQAPALAGLLREAFDAMVPQDVEAWVQQAHALSRQQRAAQVPMGERRPQLLEALNRLYASRGDANPGVHS